MVSTIIHGAAFYLWAVAARAEWDVSVSYRYELYWAGTSAFPPMPREGAAAIDFIFTSSHITVSWSWRRLFCPLLIRLLERYSASVEFDNKGREAAASNSYPRPSLPLWCLMCSGLFYITWKLAEIRKKRDFLWIYLLILFAIAILSHVFWPFQSFLFLTRILVYVFGPSAYSPSVRAHMSAYSCVLGAKGIHTALIEGYYCHLLSHKRLSSLGFLWGTLTQMCESEADA